MNGDKKCGLGLINSVKENLSEFSSEQKEVLQKFLTRPVLNTSIITESGIFRIHYDTTGVNTPRYVTNISAHENALLAAAAIDSAYNFEVGFLGYPAPPADFGEGGDDLYDIYILSSQNYGATTPENVINEQQQTYTSYIDVHPEFGTPFFTHGINALQVTMAHELHHAIQLGNYIKRINPDLFFYELTSTAMEEFVFDSVNDYYAYIRNYFNTPETPLSSTDGYSSATWNIFLRDNFDYDIIKRQWEMMRTLRAMIAINNSLFERESSFTKEFSRYAKWCYFTNYRSIPDTYFEESVNYPLIDPTSEIVFSAPSQMLELNSKAAAHYYITFTVPWNNDSLVVIISNGDAQSAAENSGTFFNFDYTLYSDSSSGSRFLTADYSSDFAPDNPAFWSATEILNNIVVREDNVTIQPDGSGIEYAYPPPFYFSKNYLFGEKIFIPFNSALDEDVNFNVYTSSMELVYRSTERSKFLPGNRTGVIWDVRNDDGERVASGIYIYTIGQGDELTTGKIAIFN